MKMMRYYEKGFEKNALEHTIFTHTKKRITFPLYYSEYMSSSSSRWNSSYNSFIVHSTLLVLLDHIQCYHIPQLIDQRHRFHR